MPSGPSYEALRMSTKRSDHNERVRQQNACRPNLSGHYQRCQELCSPGPVVPRDGSRDREITIDVDFHEPDLEVLRLLGPARHLPMAIRSLKDKVVDAYREALRRVYTALSRRRAPEPQGDRMVFQRKTHVGSLEPLQYLSEEGRAAFTEGAIEATSDWRDWTLKHETQRIYPREQFDSAAAWAIKSGRPTADKQGDQRAWTAHGDAAFERWSEIASVVEWLPDEAAVHLGIPGP